MNTFMNASIAQTSCVSYISVYIAFGCHIILSPILDIHLIATWSIGNNYWNKIICFVSVFIEIILSCLMTYTRKYTRTQRNTLKKMILAKFQNKVSLNWHFFPKALFKGHDVSLSHSMEIDVSFVEILF